MRYYSPLRYPGGKAKLAEFFKLLFKQNLLLDGYYVEPFCGGAAIAFDLLINEYCSKIYINDIDKCIYSFWYSVLNKTEELCKKIINTPISVEEWKKQRHIYNDRENTDELTLGFSTFYLNRTNRSGIINGGVIGGIAQEGNWKIDARYNKKELIKRIHKIANYKDRISLSNEDALTFIKKTVKKLPRNTLFYLDPPYYNKGKDLYINYYTLSDHVAIRDLIKNMNNRYWVISYDSVKVIADLYSEFRQVAYDLNYSANKQRTGKEIMIFSNNIFFPEDILPTSKKEICNRIMNNSFY